jgi:sugar lactone lactonase YvrE
MNAPYLKPQTALVEQARWTLPRPLVEVHGMAYLDGKLYISSLGPRSAQGEILAGVGELGEFDPATGVYTTIHPVSVGGEALPYGYPGDVKVGPDGLLYLLNNGPGKQALYEMKADGTVVKEVALEGKSPLAIGLGIGPDGKLYATDMGSIHEYGPEGGSPLVAWGKATGNFNNIGGVTVDPNNRVYGAETSEKKVHIFDESGTPINVVDLGCSPWQMVVSGDWLDIACDAGMRSLNWKTGDVQVDRVGDADQPQGMLTALAYGADGTLYVYDNNGSSVRAYTVKH